MGKFVRNAPTISAEPDPTQIPHNLAAERGVVGGLIIDNSFIPKVRAILKPADFFRDAHAILYRAILELADSPSPVDSLLLLSHVESRGELVKVGGDDYLAEILADLPHALNTPHYAAIVREKALARQGIVACERASADLRSGLFSAGKALHRTSRRIDRLHRLCKNPEEGPVAESVIIGDVPDRDYDWLWPGRIPANKVTLCAGEAKIGKSFFTLWLSAAVSAGLGYPGGNGECMPAGNVVILSAEDDIDDTIKPRLIAAGADIRRVQALTTMRMPDGTRSPFTLAYIPELASLIKRIGGVRLLVIDPITHYIGSEVDDNRAAPLRAAIGPLKTLAKDMGVAVVVVSHFNKGSSPKALNRVLASGAYTALARSNWMFYRDPDDRKRRLMLDGGTNVVEDPTGLAYRIVDGRIEWEPDPISMSADEFLAETHDRSGELGGQPKAQRAQDFLAALLPFGRDLPSDHIIAAAKTVGIGRNAIFEAKQTLGIEARKIGGRGGPWHWFRPPKGFEHPVSDDEINF